MDYFLARYYSGAQGRFLSVDPENAGASKDDPQSWNAYSYTLNNPLRYVDPTGMTSVSINDLIGIGWTDQEAFNFMDSLPMNGSGYNITLFQYERSQAIFAEEMYSAFLEGLRPKVEVQVSYPDPGTLASGRMDDASLELWSSLGGVKALWSLGRGLLVRKSENVILRQINKSLSKNTIKHIVNRGHLAEFQRLSPSLTIEDVMQIGIKVAETGRKAGTNTFIKTMQIGGKQVTVKSVVNSNNALRSVYLVQ